MARSFEGQVVLVTGGSSGIGLELSRLLAAEGGRVWLLARRQDVLAQALQSLPVMNGQSHGMLSADVTKMDEVQAAVDRLAGEAGPPDVLVNAAGSSHPAYVQETTVDIYREMMELNYFGIVNMLEAVLPIMLKRGSGYIVNFSSMAGFLAPFGYAAYSPSKYAVRGLSDSLRLELKPLGIQVSVVFPPDTDTPGMENENKTKPYETLEAFSSKLAPAPAVAKAVLSGMKRRRYAILPGFEPALYYRLVGLLGNAIYPVMDSILAQARRKKARA